MKKQKVDNAIFLAAGTGSRFAPLTDNLPKGLIKVKGVPMIEQQIMQLHQVGIKEIIIVVGYLKEKFEYLIKKYGVKLIFNPEYAVKNSLASMYCAADYLGSSYILSSDHWMEKNIFNSHEGRSWSACTYFSGPTPEWCVTYDANDRITKIVIGGKDSLATLGPVYFTQEYSDKFKKLLKERYNTPGTDKQFWEFVINDNLSTLPMYVNDQTGNVFEFDNLEELAVYDTSYRQLAEQLKKKKL